MKKRIILLVCVALLLSLCACGAETKETAPATVAPATEANVAEEATQKEEIPETTVPEETETAQETEETQDMVEVIRQYIDKPIEDLYALVGEPISSDYASSCLGDGEDGLLVYDGFVVYTYREGDVETVYDVE